MICLLCSDPDAEKIAINSSAERFEKMLLVDRPHGVSFKKLQHFSSHSSISNIISSAADTEWKVAVNEPSSFVQPHELKDGSVPAEDVYDRIVMKISSGSVVSHQKSKFKVIKEGSLNREGSGKRDGAKSAIPAGDTDLLLNQTVEVKKMSPDKDDIVFGMKPQKVKKRRNSKHEGGEVLKQAGEESGKKDCAKSMIPSGDTDLLLSQTVEFRKTSPDKDNMVTCGVKPQSKVKKRRNSKGEGGKVKAGLISEEPGKKDCANSTIPAGDTDLILNKTAGFKKKSPAKGDVTVSVPGVKQQPKEKKRRDSKGEEGKSSGDGCSIQTLATDKTADSSPKQLSKHKKALSDKDGTVVLSKKLQSKVKCPTTVKHDMHGTGDSSTAKTINKAPSLPLSPPLDCKKLPSADIDRIPKVKKHVGSSSKQHGAKSITNIKVAANDKVADFHSNLSECRKSSFDGDGTGLSGQNAQSKLKKPSCTNSEIAGTRDSVNATTSGVRSFGKSAIFSLNNFVKGKRSSSVGRNERPKFAGSKLKSGLGQGSDAGCITSQIPGEHIHRDQKQSQPSENASKTSVTKTEKTNIETKITKQAVSDQHIVECVQSKQKLHKRSLSDPHQTVHHQKKYADMTAAAESISHPSEHRETAHLQRRNSDSQGRHSESATVDSSDGLQAEKPKCNVMSSGAGEHGSQHPRTAHPQKCASERLKHQMESEAVHSADAEKPKNKVSLADYKKRKTDPKPSAVSLPTATKISEGNAPQRMKSSLAEQLISSYARSTKSAGQVQERVPLPKSLHSSEVTDDSTVTVRQDAMLSEIMGSAGDVCHFQLPGQCVWPPTQQQRGSPMFNSHVIKQMHAGSFSAVGICQPYDDERVAQMIKEDSMALSNLSLEADSCEKIDFFESMSGWLKPGLGSGHSFHDDGDKAKTEKVESDISSKPACNVEPLPVVSSHEITTKLSETVLSNSVAAARLGDQREDSTATVKQGNLTFVPDNNKNCEAGKAGGGTGLASVFSQTVDLDMKFLDESWTASVSNQDTAAASGLKDGTFNESVLKSSVSMTNLDSKTSTKTKLYTRETEMSSSDSAPLPSAPPLVSSKYSAFIILINSLIFEYLLMLVIIGEFCMIIVSVARTVGLQT